MLGIAWRNFILQFHRYRVLLAALVLGAIVFTLLFGVTTSLTTTIREKAARYFSGDVMVLGFGPRHDWVLDDERAILEAIRTAGVDIAYHHRRSLYYETDASLVFNGTSLIQRRIIGLDFSVERENFARQDFVEGGLRTSEIPLDGLWVSTDTAQRLHLRLGDEVTLIVKTIKGYRNTVSLKVAGVFQDASFFGFASYLDYRTLNKALARPESTITELGVTLGSAGDAVSASQAIWSRLKGLAPTLTWVPSLEAAYSMTDKTPPAVTSYAVLPLSGRLKAINDLIQAISWVNWLLALVFLIVVAIGVFNTYQMISFERTKEIGTMRALGMTRTSVVLLFLAESLFLGCVASVVGLVLGAAALWLVGQWDFSGNQMAQMFLQKGRVAWVWPWQNVAIVLAVMWFTTFLGAMGPALKSARLKPVDALRQD